MEVKNLDQSIWQPNQTKVNRQAHKLQTTQTNRHRDVLLLSISILHIFVPIYAVCLLVYVAVYRHNDRYALIQDLPSPPLFRSVKILVAFLQFFFWNFFGEIFFWNFFLQNSTRFFFPQGSFLWLWVFLREYIFWVKHFDRERFFFFARVVFSEIVQFWREFFW